MHFIQTYLPNAYELGLTGDAGWLTAILNTLYMTIVPFVIGGGVGLVFGLLLVLMGPEGVIENKVVCWIIDKVTSVFRAIPFVILIAVLAPLTMLLMQTNLGATAALVPLSLRLFLSLHGKYRLSFLNWIAVLLRQHKLLELPLGYCKGLSQ